MTDFAWTPGAGAYRHFPPYVNFTGNRLTVRGSEDLSGEHPQMGPTVSIDLPAEVLDELSAVIARKQVEEAIEPFERAESECPFSKSRTPSSDVPCPRCAATSNEGCRLQTIAAYAAVDALRAALHRKGVEPK